ncbi:SiaC family regulatory phosphoprotein [Labilibacter marinus]|uniref:SiaC family regulatory phosphoprotein n=1 Tax=Labilibacter marinus TaxID=1477105 RepID=UPI00082E9DC4|nr:SiaC family regulatory phosphoprotein [Labilibacter marinus]
MLKKLHLKSLTHKGEIIADANNGKIEVKGTFTYDQKDLFAELDAWMDRYFEDPQELTQVFFSVDYVPKSTSKQILNLISKINNSYSGRDKIEIFWHYTSDDEDFQKAGEDFQFFAKVPFQLVKY